MHVFLRGMEDSPLQNANAMKFNVLQHNSHGEASLARIFAWYGGFPAVECKRHVISRALMDSPLKNANAMKFNVLQHSSRCA